jgi:two-component system, NtrC family, response regulator
MEKILIVDDSEEIRKQLKWGLGKEYNVFLAANPKEALSLLSKHQPDVVTLDLGLPPDENGTEEGFRCLDNILKIRPLSKVIVITGNDERENALKAVQKGAYDFYQKPIALEELRVILRRAFYLHQIEEENRKLLSAPDRKNPVMGGMMGQCPEMLEVFSVIRKIASADVSVLISGESGTGKELVARAIHAISLRKDGLFSPINCGAIPEDLIESELFGHEKGAYTGAHVQVQGKVEYAHKGTLFLDEIGELPTHLQVKFLRFLQERSFQRVGGREHVRIDTRVVSATNIDIAKAIKDGKFREDLYYRISVVTITLPALRDRKGDILLLSNLFLMRYSEEFKKKIRGFSPSSVGLLESYEWPGNVRELENRIQRAVLMTETSIIEPHDLAFTDGPNDETVSHSRAITLKEARDKVERDVIISAIDRNKGSIVRAAEELDVSRPTLYDIMKKHSLFRDLKASRQPEKNDVG